MNEWTCDVCKYECVPIYANPCCNCVDGSKYEPIEKEGEDDERTD